MKILIFLNVSITLAVFKLSFNCFKKFGKLHVETMFISVYTKKKSFYTTPTVHKNLSIFLEKKIVLKISEKMWYMNEGTHVRKVLKNIFFFHWKLLQVAVKLRTSKKSENLDLSAKKNNWISTDASKMIFDYWKPIYALLLNKTVQNMIISCACLIIYKRCLA